jgi:hypothetical protein
MPKLSVSEETNVLVPEVLPENLMDQELPTLAAAVGLTSVEYEAAPCSVIVRPPVGSLVPLAAPELVGFGSFSPMRQYDRVLTLARADGPPSRITAAAT